jgi:secreted trypsin-like serine protease
VSFSTAALVNSSGKTFCTASLITTKHLVTAAHCLKNYSERNLFVVFGVKSILGEVSREDVRPANYFKVHPDFSFDTIRDPSADAPPADIAFVQISDDAPAFTKPIPVLNKTDRIYRGEPLLLAGFGKPRYDIQETGILRKVVTRLDKIETDKKEIVYGWTPGRSACHGDSGGPAFVSRNKKLALVGVTSRGPATCDATGTYTDVRHYRDWLISEIQFANNL